MFSNREREGRDMSRCNYYGKAFFDYQKPIFEAKIAPLISKYKLPDAEQEQVKKAFKDAKKAIVSHSARLANEAEKSWYANNGFTVSDKDGLYVYKKNK